MKRPIGVTILAVVFVALAAFGCYFGVHEILTDLDDPIPLVTGLFFVVMAFMSAALGLGLWNLEEDARWSAIAVFVLPSVYGLLVGSVAAFYEKPPILVLVTWMTFWLLIGAPAVYLMRPRIKATFDQLVIVRLQSCLRLAVSSSGETEQRPGPGASISDATFDRTPSPS